MEIPCGCHVNCIMITESPLPIQAPAPGLFGNDRTQIHPSSRRCGHSHLKTPAVRTYLEDNYSYHPLITGITPLNGDLQTRPLGSIDQLLSGMIIQV